jgi:hypothetical protein
MLYDECLLEKPVMIDLEMCLVSEGKRNPGVGARYGIMP